MFAGGRSTESPRQGTSGMSLGHAGPRTLQQTVVVPKFRSVKGICCVCDKMLPFNDPKLHKIPPPPIANIWLEQLEIPPDSLTPEQRFVCSDHFADCHYTIKMRKLMLSDKTEIERTLDYSKAVPMRNVNHVRPPILHNSGMGFTIIHDPPATLVNRSIASIHFAAQRREHEAKKILYMTKKPEAKVVARQQSETPNHPSSTHVHTIPPPTASAPPRIGLVRPPIIPLTRQRLAAPAATASYTARPSILRKRQAVVTAPSLEPLPRDPNDSSGVRILKVENAVYTVATKPMTPRDDPITTFSALDLKGLPQLNLRPGTSQSLLKRSWKSTGTTTRPQIIHMSDEFALSCAPEETAIPDISSIHSSNTPQPVIKSEPEDDEFALHNIQYIDPAALEMDCDSQSSILPLEPQVDIHIKDEPIYEAAMEGQESHVEHDVLPEEPPRPPAAPVPPINSPSPDLPRGIRFIQVMPVQTRLIQPFTISKQEPPRTPSAQSNPPPIEIKREVESVESAVDPAPCGDQPEFKEEVETDFEISPQPPDINVDIQIKEEPSFHADSPGTVSGSQCDDDASSLCADELVEDMEHMTEDDLVADQLSKACGPEERYFLVSQQHLIPLLKRCRVCTKPDPCDVQLDFEQVGLGCRVKCICRQGHSYTWSSDTWMEKNERETAPSCHWTFIWFSLLVNYLGVARNKMSLLISLIFGKVAFERFSSFVTDRMDLHSLLRSLTQHKVFSDSDTLICAALSRHLLVLLHPVSKLPLSYICEEKDSVDMPWNFDTVRHLLSRHLHGCYRLNAGKIKSVQLLLPHYFGEDCDLQPLNLNTSSLLEANILREIKSLLPSPITGLNLSATSLSVVLEFIVKKCTEFHSQMNQNVSHEERKRAFNDHLSEVLARRVQDVSELGRNPVGQFSSVFNLNESHQEIICSCLKKINLYDIVERCSLDNQQILVSLSFGRRCPKTAPALRVADLCDQHDPDLNRSVKSLLLLLCNNGNVFNIRDLNIQSC